ncbi:gamma-glutamylcyclotransferase [Sulfurospirillum arcachonense]|uniref:gamma-glutamylcyclotransferase n=1 Tax=Sulfurospirillum arcachonense TaxID=57666 RepID=UPI000468BA34|nr:gamma-glutamylcyclotransferase [Sulfurospirillum arcachonense]
MYYFAYGSNMSVSRLQERVPSAIHLGCYSLKEHDLRFHKFGQDESAKCDAYFTANSLDIIYGALFKINPKEKPSLDKAEGLGHGYEIKEVTITATDGSLIQAMTYIASHIDETIKPFSWYMNHVLIGAQETSLPSEYIQSKMHSIETIEDENKKRDKQQRAIHS